MPSLVFWGLPYCGYEGTNPYPALGTDTWRDARGASVSSAKIEFTLGQGRSGISDLTLNGRQLIRFKGGAISGANWRWLNAEKFGGSHSAEVWALFRITSTGTADPKHELWKASITLPNRFSTFGPSTIKEWFGTDVERDLGAPLVDPTTNWIMYRVQVSELGANPLYPDGHFTAWVNGQVQAHFNSNTISWHQDLWFCPPGQNEEIVWAEISVLNRNLTDSEAVLLNQTMNTRWGQNFPNPVATASDLIFVESFEEHAVVGGGFGMAFGTRFGNS